MHNFATKVKVHHYELDMCTSNFQLKHNLTVQAHAVNVENDAEVQHNSRLNNAQISI